MLHEVIIRRWIKRQEAKRGLYPLNGATLIGWETDHESIVDLMFVQPCAEMTLETLLGIVILTEDFANAFAAEIVRSKDKPVFHLKLNEDY